MFSVCNFSIKYYIKKWLRLDNVILHDWVLDLELKKQSGLLSVIRGTDKDKGNCVKSKQITKMLRYLITKEAGKKSNYMFDRVLHINQVSDFLAKEYLNNTHFVEHILSAAYTIAHNHPNNYVKEYWLSVGNIANSRIKKIKKAEKERLAILAKIERIYNKYLDIYSRPGM